MLAQAISASAGYARASSSGASAGTGVSHRREHTEGGPPDGAASLKEPPSLLGGKRAAASRRPADAFLPPLPPGPPPVSATRQRGAKRSPPRSPPPRPPSLLRAALPARTPPLPPTPPPRAPAPPVPPVRGGGAPPSLEGDAPPAPAPSEIVGLDGLVYGVADPVPYGLVSSECVSPGVSGPIVTSTRASRRDVAGTTWRYTVAAAEYQQSLLDEGELPPAGAIPDTHPSVARMREAAARESPAPDDPHAPRFGFMPGDSFHAPLRPRDAPPPRHAAIVGSAALQRLRDTNAGEGPGGAGPR